MKPKVNEGEIENNVNNYEYKPKSIKIDISREDDEDRELISLLEEKRKNIFIINFLFNIFSFNKST